MDATSRPSLYVTVTTVWAPHGARAMSCNIMRCVHGELCALPGRTIAALGRLVEAERLEVDGDPEWVARGEVSRATHRNVKVGEVAERAARAPSST